MQLNINDKTGIEIFNEFNEKRMNFIFPFIYSNSDFVIENKILKYTTINRIKSEITSYNNYISELSEKGKIYYDILKYAYDFKIKEERKEKLLKIKEKINER